MMLRSTRPSRPPSALSSADLLALPRINVSGTRATGALAAAHAAIDGAVLVDDLAGLHQFLSDLSRLPPSADSVLDLVGLSTGTGALVLGSSVLDATCAEVLDRFEAIGQEQLLLQLGVRAVRLIGARTATEPAGQDALRRLRQFLGVPIYGTTGLLCAHDLGPAGLARSADELLVDDRAAAPRRPPTLPAAAPRAKPFTFEAMDVIRASALPAVTWPRFVVPRTFDLRQLSSQIRDNGQVVPHVLAQPRCELLLPAGKVLGEERFRVLEVLFNWELVRIRGPELPDGALYPVVSSQRFTQLVNLPMYQP